MFQNKIYQKENGFLSVDMKTQLIPSLKYTVQHYLYGRCHLFALKLHEIKSMEPVMFCHYALYQYFLRHAACIINDEYVVDASGIRTYQSVIDEYCKSDEDFRPDMIRVLRGERALEILTNCTKYGEYYLFDTGEHDSLESYIHFMSDNRLLSL